MGLCGDRGCGCAVTSVPQTTSAQIAGDYPTINVSGAGTAASPWSLSLDSGWAQEVSQGVPRYVETAVDVLAPETNRLYYEWSTGRMFVYDGTDMVWISGTAPRAIISRTTTQSIANAGSGATIAYSSGTEVVDTDSLHGAGVDDGITIPSDPAWGGDWLVSIFTEWDSSSTGRRRHWVEVTGNTVTGQADPVPDITYDAATGAATNMTASAVIRLDPGAVLTHRVYQNSGGALNMTQALFSAVLLAHVPSLT